MSRADTVRRHLLMERRYRRRSIWTFIIHYDPEDQQCRMTTYYHRNNQETFRIIGLDEACDLIIAWRFELIKEGDS